MDHRPKSKTIKHLKNNKGENLGDPQLADEF